MEDLEFIFIMYYLKYIRKYLNYSELVKVIRLRIDEVLSVNL